VSPEKTRDAVVTISFLEVPQVLVLPPKHPLTREYTLTYQNIAAYPLIAHNAGRPLGAKIDAAFREAGVVMNYVVEALDADVMKAYVRAGLGIAIIPQIACDREHDNDLEFRELPPNLFGTMHSTVLLRNGTHLGRSCKDFLELLSPLLERQRIEQHLAGMILT
jgi:DNA-binding transcriptional LysR family regulator